MKILVLALCLALGFLLRLYMLPQMVGFNFDQEYAAQFAYDVIKIFPIRMIGQGMSIEGLFMGPWYFYYLVPFMYLSNLHPIGGYYASVLLGMIIVGVYFFILKDVFGTKVGLIAAFLRSFLLYFLVVDWSMVPSLSSELLVLIVWWSMYKYWHKEYFYLLPLFLCFGLFFSFHPIQFPFFLVFGIIVLLKRNIPPLRYFILCPIFFIVPVIPLLAFEYFRGFVALKTLTALDNTTKSEVKGISTLIAYLGIVKDWPKLISGVFGSSILILVLVALAAFKRSIFKNGFHRVFFGATLIVFVLYYFILPTHVPEYYFTGVGITIFIYLVAALGSLRGKWGKIAVAIVLASCFITSLVNLINLWTKSDGTSLYDKERVLFEIQKRQQGSDNYDITYDITPGNQFGLGYLRRIFGIEPQGDSNSPLYTIIIPYEERNKGRVDFKSGSIGLRVDQR